MGETVEKRREGPYAPIGQNLKEVPPVSLLVNGFQRFFLRGAHPSQGRRRNKKGHENEPEGGAPRGEDNCPDCNTDRGPSRIHRAAPEGEHGSRRVEHEPGRQQKEQAHAKTPVYKNAVARGTVMLSTPSGVSTSTTVAAAAVSAETPTAAAGALNRELNTSVKHNETANEAPNM